MLVLDFRSFSSLSAYYVALRLDKTKCAKIYKIEQRFSYHIVLEPRGKRKELVSQYPL